MEVGIWDLGIEAGISALTIKVGIWALTIEVGIGLWLSRWASGFDYRGGHRALTIEAGIWALAIEVGIWALAIEGGMESMCLSVAQPQQQKKKTGAGSVDATRVSAAGSVAPATPQLPRVRAGASTVYNVISAIRFPSLALSSFDDDAFAADFEADFQAQMAGSAGTSISAVGVTNVVAGSTTVESAVVFSGADAAAAFAGGLEADVAAVFTYDSFLSFGAPNATEVVTVIGTVVTLDYAEPEVEYEEVPPDFEPPILTLLGEASEFITQGAVYVDPGVTCGDKVDGACQGRATGAEAVDTSQVTDDPFIIRYDAQDVAGNAAAQVTREVWVVSPCLLPSTLCSPQTGEEEGAAVCSSCEAGAAESGAGENVTCLCLTEVELEESVTEVAGGGYTPPADVASPVMTLLGDGQLARTSEDVLLMIHHLPLYEEFVDPGVIAEDNVDGNITEKVSAYGVAAVDTSAVTGDDAPYVITYSVSDAANNSAAELRRRVYVYNPCGDPAETPICAGGACTEGSLCLNAELEEEAPAEVAPPPPTLTLNGPAALEVRQGSGYSKCTEFATLSEACDRGAQAFDEMDGVLDSEVLACSPDGVSYKWVNKGVEACHVDTDIPGVYSIRYEVKASSGLRAYVSRNVTVVAACPTGEFVCTEQVSCSQGGTCLANLEGGVESALAAEEEPTDAPPTLQLRRGSAQAASADLTVRQHAAYAACEEGAEPQAEAPCELGAEAWDDDDGDLTLRVLSCPPENCLASGCPGHEFAVKGVEGCVDTSADPGTVFEVLFAVLDSAVPANLAVVSRIVTIDPPCADGAELCADGECSSADCDDRDAVLYGDQAPPDVTPPEIRLLGAARVRLVVGFPDSGLRFAPCPALDQDTGCYAHAEDAEDGDVCASIVVEQVAAAGETLCRWEDAPRATCYPGVYTYVYRAEDAARNSASAELVVEVVEARAVSTEVQLESKAEDAAAAEEEAGALRNVSSGESAAFRQAIADLLNDGTANRTGAGLPTTPGDVNVTSVEVEAAVEGGYRILVAFAVDALVAGEGEDAAVGRRRRRRLAEVTVPEDEYTEVMSEVEALAAEFGELLEESVSPEEGGAPVAMSEYLAAAAAATQGVGLSTDVGGLSQNVTTEAVSKPVDETAAHHSTLMAELEAMSDSLNGTAAAAGSTQQLVAAHVEGEGSEQQLRVENAWSLAFNTETGNVDALSASLEQALENADKALAPLQEMQASLSVTNNEEATTAQETQNEVGDNLEEARVPAPPPASTTSSYPPPSSAGMLSCTEVNYDTLEYHVQVGAVSAGSSSPDASAGLSDGGEGPPGRRLSGDVPDPGTVDSAGANVTQRVVAVRNVLLVGMMLSSRRREAATCTERFQQLAAGSCFTGPYVEQPYGTDAVFNMYSELYEAEITGQEGAFYNLSAEQAAFDNATGRMLVHPFSAVSETGDSSKTRFRAFYNRTLSGPRAEALTVFLEDSAYLGVATADLNVRLLLWNGDLDTYTFVDVDFVRVRGGYFEAAGDIAAIDGALLEVADHPWKLALTLVLVPLCLCLFREDLRSVREGLWEFMEFRGQDRLGKLETFARLLYSRAAAPVLILVSLWVLAVLQIYAALRVRVGSERAVNIDDYAVSNYLLADEAGATESVEVLDAVDRALAMRSLFWAYSCFTLQFLVLRVLRACECHPRLNLINGTLQRIGTELAHLVTILFYILLCFTVAAHILWGPVSGPCSEDFANLNTAAVTIGDAFAGGGLGSCMDTRPGDTLEALRQDGRLHKNVGGAFFSALFTSLVTHIVTSFFFTIIVIGYNMQTKISRGHDFFHKVGSGLYVKLQRSARGQRMWDLMAILESGFGGMEICQASPLARTAKRSSKRVKKAMQRRRRTVAYQAAKEDQRRLSHTNTQALGSIHNCLASPDARRPGAEHSMDDDYALSESSDDASEKSDDPQPTDYGRITHNAMYSGDTHNASYSGDTHNAMYSGDTHNAMYSGDTHNAMYSGDTHNATYSADTHNATCSGDTHNATYSGDTHNAAYSGDTHNAMYSIGIHEVETQKAYREAGTHGFARKMGQLGQTEAVHARLAVVLPKVMRVAFVQERIYEASKINKKSCVAIQRGRPARGAIEQCRSLLQLHVQMSQQQHAHQRERLRQMGKLVGACAARGPLGNGHFLAIDPFEGCEDPDPGKYVGASNGPTHTRRVKFALPRNGSSTSENFDAEEDLHVSKDAPNLHVSARSSSVEDAQETMACVDVAVTLTSSFKERPKKRSKPKTLMSSFKVAAAGVVAHQFVLRCGGVMGELVNA
ncbi:hypothetical protein CYMTET_37988 [Cymbomonas tetramitiformis]|uniref:Pesticidal crystal protein Cry22Aa Ig-like domain-containing protein n=1 Tax=Cymbomonas tetramitiformis TaxID=36881 RepID=A0AAE0F5F2_9CHLO|nr:hypothetical protein CYMTET_37988 [Cymbomonas tetramitiformis]